MYCQRMWTVFEQYTATRLDVPVTIILPPEQNQSFHAQLKTAKLENVIESLSTINVEEARAGIPEDEEKLRALIALTG